MSTRTPGTGRHDPAVDPARARARSHGPGPRPPAAPRWRGRTARRHARQRSAPQPRAARPRPAGTARGRCRCPATSSVTPCSTWSRVLTSRKWKAPSASRRNSAVAAFRSPPAVATRTARSCRWRRSAGRQPGRRRLLDELLVASLERAVALPDRDDRAHRIAQQLDLDVPRGTDLALQEDRTVAKGRCRLGRSGGQRRGQLGRVGDPPHPPSPTAGGGLDQQREADPLGLGHDRVEAVGAVDRDRLAGARHALDPHRPRDLARPDLVPQRLDDRGRRPDEDESGVLDGARERRPLGQEPVPGMDRLDAVGEGRLDDRVDTKVALGRWRRTDPDGAVSLPDVQRAGVGVAVDGDRLHAQLVTGADDPDGDLAAVGDQDATEWRRRPASPPRRVFAQRHGLPAGVRAGCCHASFAGSCRACRPASPAPG